MPPNTRRGSQVCCFKSPSHLPTRWDPFFCPSPRSSTQASTSTPPSTPTDTQQGACAGPAIRSGTGYPPKKGEFDADRSSRCLPSELGNFSRLHWLGPVRCATAMHLSPGSCRIFTSWLEARLCSIVPHLFVTLLPRQCK